MHVYVNKKEKWLLKLMWYKLNNISLINNDNEKN